MVRHCLLRFLLAYRFLSYYPCRLSSTFRFFLVPVCRRRRYAFEISNGSSSPTPIPLTIASEKSRRVRLHHPFVPPLHPSDSQPGFVPFFPTQFSDSRSLPSTLRLSPSRPPPLLSAEMSIFFSTVPTDGIGLPLTHDCVCVTKRQLPYRVSPLPLFYDHAVPRFRWQLIN